MAHPRAWESNRQAKFLPASKTDTLDWSPLLGLDTLDAMTAAAASLLDAETFTASSTHDALGRVLAAVSPDGSAVHYAYDEGGTLQRVTMQHRGAALVQTIVGELEYDAKGRRTRVVYGPLDAPTSTTRYTHDELSGRLLRLRTVRGSDDAVLQSLHYHHDPVGNVTDIRDTAQATVYFANAVVEAANSYTYDPLYRLIEATGREHASEGTGQRTHQDLVSTPHPMTSDPSAMRRYTQRYRYDAVGNLLEMRHIPSGGAGWTRRYQVAAQGNRLLATSAPGDAEGQFSHAYQHDAHGNMLAMPHLAALVWNHDDQLAEAVAGAETLSFAYAAGARCRKYTSKPGATSEERIYVGSFELYRKRVEGALMLERESLHVSDDGGRIALIETKTVDEGQAVVQPVGVWRLQLSNHLGSAVTEITEAGQVISHEEYHPFGTSAYRAVNASIDVSPRRYRYTGVERDDETGLALHGARYYSSWLGRWTAADPIGLGGGINRFAYCGGNPINLVDPSGHAGSLTAGIWERFAGKPDVSIQVEAANYTVEDTANYLEQHPEDINTFIESQHYDHGYKMLVLGEIESRQGEQDPVTRFQQGVADAQATVDRAKDDRQRLAFRQLNPPRTQASVSAAEEITLGEEIVGELMIDLTGPGAVLRDTDDFSEAYDGFNQDPNFFTGLQLGASGLGYFPVFGVLKPIAKRADDVVEAGTEVAEGVVYKRIHPVTNETYVGQSKSPRRYGKRQKEHDRSTGVENDYVVLGNAKPGKDLDVLEEDMIRVNGGIQREGGTLQNRRHQMRQQRYRDAGGKH